ncbi:MAG: DUF3857 domain-containing transglutaminase family protein [Archangium sp.]
MLLSGLVLVLATLPLPPVEPPPAWVKPLEVPKVPEKTSGSFHTLLRDTQVRVGRDAIETFERRVWKVLNQPGVEALAKQQFSWNPASDTFALHGVWVWRNGKRRDAWHPDDARVLPQEDDLAAGLYDGRQKLVLELRDVRPGDIVEYAYTRRGENPVFNGHVTLWADQAGESAVSLLHYELSWLRERELRAFPRGGAKQPDVTTTDGGTVFSWTLRDVAAMTWEEHTPDDVDQIPYVVFTDWHDWSTVRAWAQTLFALPATGQEFDDLVTRLRELPEEQRAREAVRVVQDEIRYVGVELGQHSHQPHDPAWVLERGFGDCKDKSLLLVSLLRAVGLEAWPALVNTDAAEGFADEPPSASHFNHAIALVNLPTGPTFIDGTMTLNRGPLDIREPVAYRYALVIREGETGLTTIERPMPLAPTWDVTQKWHTRADGSAELNLITVARGHEAPALRRTIERRTREDLERSWRERRVEDFDTELTMVSLDWNDDVEAETFTLTERYLVGRFYPKDDEHRFRSTVIEGDLTWLPETPRRQPWKVDAPLHVHERIEWMDSGRLEPTNFTTSNQTIDGEVFVLRSQQSVRDGKLVLDWTLKNTEARLEPSQFAAHRIATQRAADTTRYTVKGNSKPDTASPKKEHDLFGLVVGGLLVVGAMVLITWFGKAHERWALMKSRVRINTFLSKHKGSEGELASQPAVVTSVADGLKLFTSKRCPRGHAWNAPTESGGVRLGDERITVLERTCATCDANEHRYLKLKR